MKKPTYTTLGGKPTTSTYATLGSKPAKPANTAPGKSGRSTYTTLGNRWHAVSIVGGLAPCPAVLAVRGKRYLGAEAPRLPMRDCASPERCQCRYTHHSDRRVTLRRSEDRGGLPFPWNGQERRRTSRGRRADDKE